MKHFVFRNNTVERFFPKGYSFSGYDDISFIPTDVEGYVWFYQLPVRYDHRLLADEVDGYAQKLGYVLSRIDPARTVVALTMDILYHVTLTDDDHRAPQAVDDYNRALLALADGHANLKVIDIREFTRRYPAAELIDWRFYFLSQMGLNPRLSKPFMEWYARKMDSIALRRKKCLVLDLDNTLWGGILGEDGAEGIQLGGDYPGKAFRYFQEALLELSRNGVLLAVCSKNNEADVLEAWEKNPFMVLRKEHFAALRINWTDKATNIRSLAEELNIGLDAMVFVDDNPAERELVRQALPMVTVPDFPGQPYELPAFFAELAGHHFRTYSVTSEDLQKTAQYRANAQRAEARQAYADLDTFLASLDLRLTIEPATDFNIPRLAQMTQKTNQFNLTTRRYTDADIRAFVQQGWCIWCIGVADRFGDSGITGLIMVHGHEVDTLLLSCRILGKGIEVAFLRTVLGLLRREGLDHIEATYLPTAKNAQVSDFYDRCGFALTAADPDGTRRYTLDLTTATFDIKEYYHINLTQ